MKEYINFIYEMGQLSRVARTGWNLAGLEQPESIADHVLRAAQLGYIIAHLEKYENPQEVASILIFHDMGEARIGDINKVASRYIKKNEEFAVSEQIEPLGDIGQEIKKLWDTYEYQKTKAGHIAKDADLLECAVRAKEYVERGYKAAQDWIDRIGLQLKTDSAKQLYQALLETGSLEWWHGLKVPPLKR